MKRVHYTDSYLMSPQHPVTVNLIGAGGTGSQVLTCLARLDTALRGLGHPGLFVTLYDPDTVTEANIGRQLFGPSDLGQNKAQCLVTRINNFFGNDWKAQADIYPAVLKDTRRDNLANITITCTDNIKSRIDLWNLLRLCRNRHTALTRPPCTGWISETRRPRGKSCWVPYRRKSNSRRPNFMKPSIR